MIYLLMGETGKVLEAALPMNTSHDSLRGQLGEALRKAHGVSSSWSDQGPWVSNVFPEHVVYQHKGETLKRKYSVKTGSAGTDPEVTLGEPKPVHVAYMDSKTGESMRVTLADEFSISMESDGPAYERDIPKATRDKADDSDFAGKHRSFPILKAEDVAAALHAIGRAGSDNHDAATLKANILAIAKRKGFAVPSSDKKEGVIITFTDGEIGVREGGCFCDDGIDIKEAAKEAAATGKPTTIPIKIIGPGWGSSAFYSPQMIQESGPSVFTKGTQMFWNHASPSQEAERPEGDLNDLAAVLTEDAKWNESGPKGPGLYSKAKVFSDYATQVTEKGPHIGVSINAAIRHHEGEAEGRHGRIADKFTRAFSADFVTRAGAKGAPIVPVLESNRGGTGESAMTVQEAEGVAVENAALKARLATLEAKDNRHLAAITVSTVLREAGIGYSQALLERVCENPVVKEGKLDEQWTKDTVAIFTEGAGGAVTDLGGGRTTEAQAEEQTKKFRESLKRLGVPEAGLDAAVAAGRQ